MLLFSKGKEELFFVIIFFVWLEYTYKPQTYHPQTSKGYILFCVELRSMHWNKDSLKDILLQDGKAIQRFLVAHGFWNDEKVERFQNNRLTSKQHWKANWEFVNDILYFIVIIKPIF